MFIYMRTQDFEWRSRNNNNVTIMNNKRVKSFDHQARVNDTTIYGTNVSPTSVYGLKGVPRIFYQLHSKISFRLRHHIPHFDHVLQKSDS